MEGFEWLIEKNFIIESFERVKYNEPVAEFYEWLGALEDDQTIVNKADRIRLCMKFFDVDYYRMQSIKDIKRVNACHDLFCYNCQHNIALKRFGKYMPILEDLSKDFDLYHVVFTVPDSEAGMLKSTIKQMYKKFVYINQYFNGSRKSSFVDFSQFGCVGIVRSLEVEFKVRKDKLWYHPHFHCVFVLKKGLNFRKVKYNCFSHSYKNDRLRSFTRFEILLQNMWYMLYNDIPFTQRNFDEITRGYSCTADKCDSNEYHEVFKYAVGGLFKWKNRDLVCRQVLDTLYHALYRRKIIQGYGILNRFKFDLSENDDEAIRSYYEYKKRLLAFEKPVKEVQTLFQVKRDINEGQIVYISRFKKTLKVK